MSTILIETRPARPDDACALAETHDDSWRAAYQGLIPGPELEKAGLAPRPVLVGNRDSPRLPDFRC